MAQQARIFLSYRRAETASISGRIYDRLVAKFGRRQVFKDVDDIPAGVNFRTQLEETLQQCAVVLVIIGPHWLTMTTQAEGGGRRLEDPADWVRLEVETAFALGLTVIPILVEGAPIPTAADLPQSLHELPLIQNLSVRADPDFDHDVERVLRAIERAMATQRTTRRQARPTGSGAAQPAPAATGATGASATAPSPPLPSSHHSATTDTTPRPRRPVRRPFLAVSTFFVVGLVVTALLVVEGWPPFGGSLATGTGGTPAAQTATAGAQATADQATAAAFEAFGATDTAQAVNAQATASAFATQPYRTLYPGFGDSCSDNSPTAQVWSRNLGQSGHGQVQCLAGGVRLTSPNPQSGVTIGFGGTSCTYSPYPDCHWSFPHNFSFSITQLPGQWSDNVQINLWFAGSGYGGYFTDWEGQWQVARADPVTNGWMAQQVNSGAFHAGQSNQIGMQMMNGTVSFSINGNMVGQTQIPSNPTADDLAILVDTQAEFTNFVFTPLA